jgi:hypothetical protein
MKKQRRTKKLSPKAATTPASAGPVAVATTKVNQARSLAAKILLVIATLLKGPLTSKQRRALLKSPLAGVQVIPALFQIALSKPNLIPTGANVQLMQENMAILQLLQVLISDLSGVSEQVQDTVRQMQSEVNKVGMDIYGIAIHNTSDPTVKAVVGKMKTAMASGPREKKYIRTPAPRTKLVRVPVDQADSSGSSTTSTSSTSPTAPTASAPQVPVYTPDGQAGTAPATNGK